MARWIGVRCWGGLVLALGCAACGGDKQGAGADATAPVANTDSQPTGDGVVVGDPGSANAVGNAGEQAAAQDGAQGGSSAVPLAGAPVTTAEGTGSEPVADAPLTYSACGPGERVGAFSIALIRAMEGAPPFTQITGRVRDAGDPREVWQEVMADGDCRLIVGPSYLCDPRCATGENCVGENECVPAPTSVDVGVVTIEGLGVEAQIKPNPGNGQYYFAPPAGMMLAYPPFEERAPLTLSATGGEYGPFSLRGQGIPPLEIAAEQFTIAPDTALELAWTPPQMELASRIQVLVDIAHHGGISARIECELPDNGAATISPGLINALMERGVAGFPIVALARRVVDSTEFKLGCVEFAVVSSVERPAMIPGLNSCNVDEDCPQGQFCAQGRMCSEG